MLSLRGDARFYFARIREKLWLRPLIACVLSVLAAYLSSWADDVWPQSPWPDISEESLKTLLSIISSSMLGIAVFATGAMLSAYASASSTATPRSFPLVVSDDVSQNALSAFIGAFIFSVVSMISLFTDLYGNSGRFALLILTIFVFVLVILSFVHWVDRIARLGRLGYTIEKVEAAANAALQRRAESPNMDGCEVLSTHPGVPVFSDQVGYVQTIDLNKLQKMAEQYNGKLRITAPPGTFVTPSDPLAYLTTEKAPPEKDILATVANTFVIGSGRTFESDARFGLIVLAEIASKALSPAVNDPGTAIDVIGTFVRLFVDWNRTTANRDGNPVKFSRVELPALSINDMLDDAFNPIARDGASTMEVTIRLQKALQSLAELGHQELKQSAIKHSRLAVDYAEQALSLDLEIEAIRAVASWTKQAEEEQGRGTR